MKNEIKYALYLMGLGFCLIAYAHSQFATKSTVEKMDDRVYEIWKEVVKK
jgi:bacteriorhodopsin